ncbi:cell division protein FtsA [Cerasibacillus quisquiliarum]|uniref:ATPase n=1 Tax=Cerasibacillus quisquiliarum TaxID=227865 RepID=A0A511V056_9BACI|nr:cell division FtsA domain-containing protein [Cerasibacillus quisquiliarum]MBB5147346.1 cell division protein FtsA [Cerasibacillus quisquiliarum]GEN32294.1 ATPase [Cerasibacillus quisquiliarum]
MGESIFSLDIGTRTVTGIILKKEKDTYHLIDYCLKEHQDRSMHDGQIHDVIEVSQVIEDVKRTLEEKHGPLHDVSVAAAGRSLKTIEGQAEITLDKRKISNEQMVKHLELSAVNDAQRRLAKNDNTSEFANYYCVGYSVLHYKLDHESIGSLIDQQGNIASVEVIATFLPKVVVESLFAAIQRADLSMKALTLEPIAAIQLLVPESMRRLNIALVDIGAGTSDIALTADGTVTAYGMVPIAGDEVTEAISDHYLLDFPEAEQMKRQIVHEGEATVTDILGFQTEVTLQELNEKIHDTVHNLAHAIAEEIITLNKRPPRAIMLIGGGSLTPLLPQLLAKKLQLPINRVAVRRMDAIKDLITAEKTPTGPDFITPIGIAMSGIRNPIQYVTVHVNNEPTRLFEMNSLTVGDACVQAGIDMKKLYGKPGHGYVITINGKSLQLPGEFGQAPEILVNNTKATVDTIIKNGDIIEVHKGKDGSEPHVTIKQLFGDMSSIRVYYNKKPFHVKAIYEVNGKLVSPDYKIKDKDVISFKNIQTIKDFFSNILGEPIKDTGFYIYINRRKVQLNNGVSLTINGVPAHPEQRLKDNDSIEYSSLTKPTVKDLLQTLNKEYWYKINVTFNHKVITLRKKRFIIKNKQGELKEADSLSLGEDIRLIEKKFEPFIFQDIFRYIDIQTDQMRGTYRLMKNDVPTQFDAEIVDGDRLSIKWGV